MNKSIVLIGPIAVGKTTVAKKLNKQLNMPYVSLDIIKLKYFKEKGYCEKTKNIILNKLGWQGVYKYYKSFNTYAVYRVLQDYNNHIIEIGGGCTVCNFYNQQLLLKKAFINIQNSFLLLPSKSFNESINILNNRTKWHLKQYNYNKDFLPYYYKNSYTNFTIYTKKLSTTKIVKQILSYTTF